jgi:5'-nucleotidase
MIRRTGDQPRIAQIAQALRKALGAWGPNRRGRMEFGLCLSLLGLAFATTPNSSLAAPASPASVQLTILHTNDLHSHFKPEKGGLQLGGIARIKTLADQIRTENPFTLFVDGGDWSEGHIYYTEGAGRETLRMMDRMGYDVAVVGNHDWYNGPETLLTALQEASPRMQIISANLDLSKFQRAEEFRKAVLPYVIKNVGGLRVGILGLSTYEKIFDYMLAPVVPTEPFLAARRLADSLKRECDVVFALSHNSVSVNKLILKVAPSLDFIIGAHDHQKLTTPVVVARDKREPGFIVETGSWGRYLGRVDLEVTPRNLLTISKDSSQTVLRDYRLLQVDSRLPEDPEILAAISQLEARIEARMGPLFSNRTGETEFDLVHGGLESTAGNLIPQAYLSASGADLALEISPMAYGEIFKGEITRADSFNALPGIYNPKTGRAWTLKIGEILGKDLLEVFRVFYFNRNLSRAGLLETAGIELVFKPILNNEGPGLRQANFPFGAEGVANTSLESVLMGDLPFSRVFESLSPSASDRAVTRIFTEFKIQGQPINLKKLYRVALSGGVAEVIKVANSLIPSFTDFQKITETGIEDWQILDSYLRKNSPINGSNLKVGGKIRTFESDLGISPTETKMTGLVLQEDGTVSLKLSAWIRNFGYSPSLPGAKAGVYTSKVEADLSRGYDVIGVSAPVELPALAPGEGREVEFDVRLPLHRGYLNWVLAVRGMTGEVNPSNDQVVHWEPLTLQATSRQGPQIGR